MPGNRTQNVQCSTWTAMCWTCSSGGVMLAASMLSQHTLQIFMIPYFLKPLPGFEFDLRGLKAMHPGAPHLIPLGISASNGDVGSLPTSGTEGHPGGPPDYVLCKCWVSLRWSFIACESGTAEFRVNKWPRKAQGNPQWSQGVWKNCPPFCLRLHTQERGHCLHQQCVGPSGPTSSLFR